MCKYVHRYIECITDQSNWSGPFSLVAVCSLYNLGVVSSIPSRGARRNFFTDFSPPYYICKQSQMNCRANQRTKTLLKQQNTKGHHEKSYLAGTQRWNIQGSLESFARELLSMQSLLVWFNDSFSESRIILQKRRSKLLEAFCSDSLICKQSQKTVGLIKGLKRH